MKDRVAAPVHRSARNAPWFSTTCQWVLIAGALSTWLLWPGPAPSPPVEFGDRSNWDGFQALVYGGVLRLGGDRAVTTSRLEEHLEAMRAAGYHPISVNEARRFLQEGAPLPPRAVLLAFDGGRRETVREAERVLAVFRFPALLFLRLDAMDRGDHLYPSWHEVRALVATGRWTLGSHGVRAREPVEADAAGARAPFLTSPAFLVKEGRAETGSEWEARVTGDLRLSARLLRRNVPGWKPEVFAYPYADGGQAMEDGGQALRRIIGGRFPLAFAETGYAFNHRRRAPHRLTWLAVDPSWTGKELVRWLDAQGARRQAFEPTSEEEWVLRYGRLTVARGNVVLEPEEGRSADAWLAGSESWRCLSGQVSLEARPEAQAWLYLRAKPGGSFLRIGWTGRRVEVQVKAEGGLVETVAHGRLPAEQGRAAISFEVLDRRVRFAIDGGQAPERSFPLPAWIEAGMAGLGTWLPEGGGPPMAFKGLRLEPRPARAALVRGVSDARTGPASGAVDVLAPLWFEVKASGGEVHVQGEPEPALSLLAAHRGAAVWPVVQVREGPAGPSVAALAREIDRAARAAGAPGIVLDPRPARAAGKPLDPAAWPLLLASTATPLAAIPDLPFAEFAAACPVEELAWLVVPAGEAGSLRAPPELLLVVEAPQKREEP